MLYSIWWNYAEKAQKIPQAAQFMGLPKPNALAYTLNTK